MITKVYTQYGQQKVPSGHTHKWILERKVKKKKCIQVRGETEARRKPAWTLSTCIKSGRVKCLQWSLGQGYESLEVLCLTWFLLYVHISTQKTTTKNNNIAHLQPLLKPPTTSTTTIYQTTTTMTTITTTHYPTTYKYYLHPSHIIQITLYQTIPHTLQPSLPPTSYNDTTKTHTTTTTTHPPRPPPATPLGWDKTVKVFVKHESPPPRPGRIPGITTLQRGT